MKLTKIFRFFSTKRKTIDRLPKSNNIINTTILGTKALSASKSSDSPKPAINLTNIQPSSSADAFENYELNYGYSDDYEIVKRIGSGKYSQVYEGINIVNDKEVIIKVLKPVKKRKIRREVAILKLLKDHENIVKLIDVIVDPSSKTPSFVYEKIENVDFKILFPKLTGFEIKFYMYKVLEGLAYAHSKGIMHRDIKPHNIIINPKEKVLKIIDWGLAEVYSDKMEYSVRVASRFYKSPELLVENAKYDYSMDIWSFGCMLAGLIFKKEPFFHGNDNNDQLYKIIKVLGTDDLKHYLDKFNLKLTHRFGDDVNDGISKKQWTNFITTENEKLCTPEALDLLSKCLVFDHSLRITAEGGMSHAYFHEVREFLKNEDRSKMINI